jgi:AcrR family transcriptional regulator
MLLCERACALMNGLMMLTSKRKTIAKQALEENLPSPRARGKDHRRARLIRAARDLMAERVDGNFSMQELATRAGLSLATPYNLLGSKAAIIQQVFRVETQGFRLVSTSGKRMAPVERVMATVEHTLAVIASKPRFYRNLSRNLSALDPEEMRRLILPFADTMLLPMVEDLVAEGAISVAVSPRLITTHLQHIFESTFQHWAILGWQQRLFRKELRAGFALTFLGLFKGKNREALLLELDTL